MTTCVQIAPPAALLTLDEAKRQVRQDEADDDLYLSGLIAAAQGQMEGSRGDLGRSIMPQAWELRLDADAWLPVLDRVGDRAWSAVGIGTCRRWPCGVVPVPLPYPPMIAVDAVTYRDDTGAPQTLTGWQVIGDPENAPMLLPVDGTSWPAASLAPECIRIRYRSGYVARDEDGTLLLDEAGKIMPAVPAALKHAALLMLGHLYEHRGASVQGGQAVPLPMGYDALVGRFRVWS